uniref:Uncharacterized protein n=1 Tax=Arundo donax TaxID=35708 RepID=A0A0A8YVT2_ARUDO
MNKTKANTVVSYNLI